MHEQDNLEPKSPRSDAHRVFSTLPLALILAACATPTTYRPATVRTDVDVANLIPDEATQVLWFAPAMYPMGNLLGAKFGARGTRCWVELERKLVSAYQIPVAGTALYILEGDLPRAEAEKCVPIAMGCTGIPVMVTREGELSKLVMEDGSTAYAAWRGRFVIIGRRDVLAMALAVSKPDRGWRERLAQLPQPRWVVVASRDLMFQNLLRVPTSGWAMVADEILLPSGTFRGHLVVRCNNASDARRLAEHLNAGEIAYPIEPSAAVRELVARVHGTSRGNLVEIPFHNKIFEGVDWAALNEYARRVLALYAQHRR